MKTLILALSLTLVISCAPRSEEGKLVHSVILKLKDDTSAERKTEIISLLKSLHQVEGTIDLFVSERAETPDKRAKTDYDIILQMRFSSLQNLKAYSEDSFHLEVRKQLKQDLGSPPIVYDYWEQ